MKIGGRIIQNKNISVNTDEKFSATYKRHHIEISLYKKERNENSEWSCEVRYHDGSYAVDAIVKRCTIHDAIVYSLNGALL